MSVNVIQSLASVMPERAPAERLASGMTTLRQNAEDNKSNRYMLYDSQESFDKAYDAEKYRQSLSHAGLEYLKGPILDNIHSQTGKVDLVPVSGKKCCCVSSWCPECFCHFYRDKIKAKFEPFDWRYTRQVVLTINPEMFKDPVEALEYIKENQSVSEFIKRLKRGVKYKCGSRWVVRHEPVKIKRWAWFREWHKNGFPHYHVFIEVEKEGREGMIGGDFLRDSWKLADWVKESYFNNENHLNKLTGYYAGKGYFEKGKQHQGILPEIVKERWKSRIKRFGSSSEKPKNNKGDKIKNDEILMEERNFAMCMHYFAECACATQKAEIAEKMYENFCDELTKDFEKEPKKRSIDYRVILSKCGNRTFIEFDVHNYRIKAISDLTYEQWKQHPEGQFVNGRGRVNKMNLFEVARVFDSIIKVVSCNKYVDVKEYCRKRSNEIDHQRLIDENIERIMHRN